MESEFGGEQPYPRAQRLRAEGKTNLQITQELMGTGLTMEDAQFVVQSLPGGSMAGGARRFEPNDYSHDDSEPAAQGGALPGWVWFVLVYGVGNVILYSTTGILLIPIPRR